MKMKDSNFIVRLSDCLIFFSDNHEKKSEIIKKKKKDC